MRRIAFFIAGLAMLSSSSAYGLEICKRVNYPEFLLHVDDDVYRIKYEIQPASLDVKTLVVSRTCGRLIEGGRQKDVYPVEGYELSSKVRVKLSVEDNWFTYLTPGLDNNSDEPFGILHCPQSLQDVKRLGSSMNCKYLAFDEDQKLSDLAANHKKIDLRYEVGAFDYSGEIALPNNKFKKAIVVNYTDSEINSLSGTSYRSAEEKFAINTIYSIVRALKVQGKLSSDFMTQTYFFSEIFSSPTSSNPEERAKERRTEVYYYNGNFAGQELIDRAALALKKQIDNSTISLIQEMAEKVDYQRISQQEFEAAIYVLQKMVSSPSSQCLERILGTTNLASILDGDPKCQMPFQSIDTVSVSVSQELEP